MAGSRRHVWPREPAFPEGDHSAGRRARSGQRHQHRVHRQGAQPHVRPDRHQRVARLAGGESAQGRGPHGRRPRSGGPAATRAPAPGVSRRRDYRRLPAHHGAGRVPEAAGRRDARTAARVFQHAAQHPFPASDRPHHVVVRRREGIGRAPAETRPGDARAQ